MCWYGNKEERENRIIADRDVEVLKVLIKEANGNYRAPQMGTHYTLGETYTLDDNEWPENDVKKGFHKDDCWPDDSYSIHEGFHSYLADVVDVSASFIANSDIGFDMVINSKVHTQYISLVRRFEDLLIPTMFVNRNDETEQVVVVKCVIPEGSVYYVDTYGDNYHIVSNSLRLVEEVEIKTKNKLN